MFKNGEAWIQIRLSDTHACMLSMQYDYGQLTLPLQALVPHL